MNTFAARLAQEEIDRQIAAMMTERLREKRQLEALYRLARPREQSIEGEFATYLKQLSQLNMHRDEQTLQLWMDARSAACSSYAARSSLTGAPRSAGGSTS